MAKIYSQLESAQVENVTSDPTPTASTVGRLIYRTDTDEYKVCDSTPSWRTIFSSLDGTLSFEGLASTPDAPATGIYKIYFKDDGKPYYLDENDNEIEIGAGGGAGGINYIDNNDFETGVSDYSTYADAAGLNPVDGTGGSATTTFAAETTDPLRGTTSGRISKDASNRQGEGVSVPFTIDAADKARKQIISFDYLDSANYADDDIRISVYDVTNGSLIRVTGEDLKAGGGKHYSSFQTASDSVSYRLIFHVSSTSALAYTVDIDNVSVGPQNISYGPYISTLISDGVSVIEGTTSNPTKGTIVSDDVKYRLVGDSMEITFDFKQSSAGTAGSGDYLFKIPGGYSIDLDKTEAFTTIIGSGNAVPNGGVGDFHVSNNGNKGIGTVSVYDETSLRAHLISLDDGTANSIGTWSSAFYGLTENPLSFSLRATVPIKGLSSNNQISQDFGGRDDVLIVEKSSTQSIPNGAWTTVTGFETPDEDTTASWTSGTSLKTIQSSGFYRVTYNLGYAINGTNTRGAALIINGTGPQYTKISQPSASDTGPIVERSITRRFTKGDTIGVQTYQSSGGVINLTSAYLEVVKEASSQQLFESEKVCFDGEINTTFAVVTDTTLKADEVVEDTHGMYNSSTGEITVPHTKKYYANACLLFGATTYSVGDAIYVDVHVNGSYRRRLFTYDVPVTNSDSRGGNGSSVIKLNAGDVVEFVATNQRGSTLTLASLDALSHFSLASI